MTIVLLYCIVLTITCLGIMLCISHYVNLNIDTFNTNHWPVYQ